MRTSNEGGSFTPAPAGMHVVRCIKIIDMGTKVDPHFGNKKRLIWVNFELPNCLIEPNDDGKQLPFLVGKRYNLSHNEASYLRLDLESWYGKKFLTADLDAAGGFDVSKIMDRPAMLNVVHSDDGKYANIQTVNPMPQGTECPARVNDLVFFDLDNFDQAVFDTLSDKMKSQIMESDEYKALFAQPDPNDPDKPHPLNGLPVDEFDDDIPF